MPNELIPFSMSGVLLEHIRLFITTKSPPSNPDNFPEFHYTNRDGGSSYNPMYLKRKKGRTELFELEKQIRIPFDDFQAVRGVGFDIWVRGGDEGWTIDHYALMGRFKGPRAELIPGRPDSTDRYEIRWVMADLGWRLLATREEDLTTGPAQSIGGYHHQIDINGHF